MQTNLASWARASELGQEADEILRRCVHCGFCLATCPTYQVLGDERDSPRGRIYLIKQVLEGAEPTRATQEHLDRCLTCRNCETTCPSGVQYGALVDIGRKIVDERVERPMAQKIQRAGLRRMLNSPLFGPAYSLGRLLRPLLPETLKNKLPAPRPAAALPADTERHERQVLMLAGCVQPSMMPSIDAATIRVLDAVGIGTRVVPGSGCCGAINFHLDAQDDALQQMRANIDAWLPLIDGGQVEAIVMNASGCGAMVKEYAHHLRHDPDYVIKALRVVAKVRDIAEILAPHADALKHRLQGLPERPAFHPPCTLQHWQGLRGVSERLLADLGFALQPFNESHLCCGSAGTYSVTQPELSITLRDRKLQAIEPTKSDCIVSSNIGCITHLQNGTSIPVRHWIEVVDEALAKTR
ncbi:glycolate oxidase subunit GlcF [Parapusillimonas granuli]|uniref:Glycolate oxidase iron-sulfur subunit n=1 Tax=Parapusillimonas granuli TaxID=380911 RepID=A0A853G199_9BURK|nr:glycolate oxidase iron-sulfur subunit [Parapusillimonas granuli]MEB2401905.1 glycolate oxidase subunit GlcF [Alcaligenaceae bacterium]NYT50077.1 glycolate oxidase subunit GlcF [Parapusillimonas granuli]